MTERIFSFGTLQLDQVQRGLFGRAVPTTPDSLSGARIGELRILDPEVIAMSGTAIHPALELTGVATDVVAGAVLEVTSAELAAADHYERVSYRRVSVELDSGLQAWAYIPQEA